MLIPLTQGCPELWQANPFTVFVYSHLQFKQLFIEDSFSLNTAEFSPLIGFNVTKPELISGIMQVNAKHIYLVLITQTTPFIPGAENFCDLHIILDKRENLLRFVSFNNLSEGYTRLNPLYQLHTTLKLRSHFLASLPFQPKGKIKLNFVFVAPELRQKKIMKKSWLSLMKSVQAKFGDLVCKATTVHPATWLFFNPQDHKKNCSQVREHCESYISCLLEKHAKLA